MSRQSMLLVVSIILAGTSARADTFGGWRYTAPPGYTVEVNTDHVALTRTSGSTFCSIAVFEARALENPARAERAYEWQNVVAHQFAATVKRRTTLHTKAGVEIAATTAALTDADGNEYAAVHYAVMPPGMIGSVLLTSSTAASLKRCEPVATAVVNSLAIDWTSPRFHDPEARVETPEGRWAAVGTTSREYTFAANGTYRFHSEDRQRVVDESGTYALVGNQLALKPLRASGAVIDRGVAKPIARMPLEKTTYTWGKRYFPETNEWHLVLTPKAATTRDGKLPTNGSAYRYSDQAKPTWAFPTQPGV
jgi:hypothetical protein